MNRSHKLVEPFPLPKAPSLSPALWSLGLRPRKSARLKVLGGSREAQEARKRLRTQGSDSSLASAFGACQPKVQVPAGECTALKLTHSPSAVEQLLSLHMSHVEGDAWRCPGMPRAAMACPMLSQRLQPSKQNRMPCLRLSSRQLLALGLLLQNQTALRTQLEHKSKHKFSTWLTCNRLY